MRPSIFFSLVIVGCLALQLSFMYEGRRRSVAALQAEQQMREIVTRFGLSDICVATDARYIRHAAVSDPLAPFMDHPGAIEHFPTGSFWKPAP